MSELTQRFDAVCERLETACLRAGRKPETVQLAAVSKRHGAGAVAELAAYWAGSGKGRPVFGESYMQEAREKMPETAALLGDSRVRPSWHFIGHLQSRKAKDVVGFFDLIHSVDSAKVARNLHSAWESRIAGTPVGLDEPAPGPQAILLQVNIGREEQKSGVDPDKLEELAGAVLELPGLSLQGLMCIPPAVTAEEARPHFALLRELHAKVESACGVTLPHLSMGMSGDFEAAVEEGATLVRIGTDIFGLRD